MNEKIQLYESLLNELASLEKECIHYNVEYIREFGDEINNIFSLKIDTIALKKKIAYCIKKENLKEEIFLDKLEKYIKDRLASYNQELEGMIERKKSIDAIKSREITFDEKKNIKRLYYQIVHLIHPDLHPELLNNKKVSVLWQKCVDAYVSNDLKKLKRVYDQVLLIVDNNSEIILNNIDIKIETLKKEIEEIKDNNPYKYKYILEDEEEIRSLHQKNNETEDYYLAYIKKLSKDLSKFNIIKNKRFDA